MKKLLLIVSLFFNTILFSQEITLKIGCVSGNCKNGFGKFVYENGTVYEGKFKKSKYEGIGTVIYANGEKGTGEFKDGQQMGQAKIIFADGNIWEGKSIYGNPNGYGKMIYLNGTQYTGEMTRWYNKIGEGIYTLSNRYTKKGTFKEGTMNTYGLIEKFEYFNADNQSITKEEFEYQERITVAAVNQNFSQQQDSKLQQFILKNKGTIVQDITIPVINSTDLSDMSFRSSNIDILFSNSKDNLLCINRKKISPSSYDFNYDFMTVFSANSQKRLYSGTYDNFEQTEIGRKMEVKFFEKPQTNEFKPNYSDEVVKKFITDLNILTAPAGNVEFEIANENYMIFKDLHRQDNDNKKTFYFINKKTNNCEKVVTLNGKYIDLVWNEDLTKSCIKLNSKLPENLVPDVYKFDYYVSLFIIDWETFQVKFIDDHVNQLNYLALAKSDKLASDRSYQKYNAEVAAINKQNAEIEAQNAAAQYERTSKCTCCHGTGQQEIKGMYLGQENVTTVSNDGVRIIKNETVSTYSAPTFKRCRCYR